MQIYREFCDHAMRYCKAPDEHHNSDIIEIPDLVYAAGTEQIEEYLTDLSRIESIERQIEWEDHFDSLTEEQQEKLIFDSAWNDYVYRMGCENTGIDIDGEDLSMTDILNYNMGGYMAVIKDQLNTPYLGLMRNND